MRTTQSPGARPAGDAAGADGVSCGPIRVLHVEDDRLDQELVRDALQHEAGAFTITNVMTLEELAHALVEPRFECIVSDLHLPGFDGLDVLGLARRLAPQIPVVFMTGTGSEEQAVEAMKRGADDYIVKKPSHIRKLPEALRSAMARHRTEEALRLSEERLRVATEAGTIGLWDLDLASKQPYMSPIWKRQLGFEDAELPNTAKAWFGRVHPADRTRVLALFQEAEATAQVPDAVEYRLRHKDGTYRWVLVIASLLRDASARPIRIVGVNIDITERKQSELHLRRVNRALKLLSRCNLVLVRAADERTLLQEACEVLARDGGFALAWAGMAGPNDSIEVAASAGAAAAYLDGLPLDRTPPADGQDPVAAAIASGGCVVVADVESDGSAGPWRRRAIEAGLRGCIAQPLRMDERVLGAIGLYSALPLEPDTEEFALLEELASDLAYGIAARRTERDRDRALAAQQRSHAQWAKALEDAVQAIATAAELRDAYTAGHQRRVALLATAIAQELRLSQKRIHGLRLASVVHDIGKITVPADVLSKPSRLSPIEYEMVQTHAQAGYDILKGIDFPWPIAQIVLQHHERLGGQGYPDGLSGEQILLEARILGVADTVEAMASHRPYRPGLGIEAALAEIERGSGVLFDPKVVEACLRLFRAKGYALPD